MSVVQPTAIRAAPAMAATPPASRPFLAQTGSDRSRNPKRSSRPDVATVCGVDRHSGASGEMLPTCARERHWIAFTVVHAHPWLRDDWANARRAAAAACEVVEQRRSLVFGCGKTQFVIVAAGKLQAAPRSGIEQTRTAPTTSATDRHRSRAPTPLAAQICPRSASRPSEISMQACARPRKSRPWATRGDRPIQAHRSRFHADPAAKPAAGSPHRRSCRDNAIPRRHRRACR